MEIRAEFIVLLLLEKSSFNSKFSSLSYIIDGYDYLLLSFLAARHRLYIGQ